MLSRPVHSHIRERFSVSRPTAQTLMAREAGRRRRALAIVYPVGVMVAVAVSLLLGRHTGGSVVALALGLFAALLTAITLVILLTLDVDSRWPSLQDIVAEAYLIRWFLLAMLAVTLAAFFDDGTKARWLTTLAIMLSLAGGFLGSLSLYYLFRISTGEGRQHFLGEVLSRRVARVGHRARAYDDAADSPALASYLSRFQSAIDKRDITALRDRVAELDIAGHTVGGLEIGALLALDLRVLRDLGRAVVLGRLDSPEIGSVLFPTLGRTVIDHAGRVLDSTTVGRGASPNDTGQLEAATYLAQAARTFAWICAATYGDAVEKGHAPPAFNAVAAGSVTARDLILDTVDPSSAHHLAADEPWHDGLVQPSAALAWWWAFCDLNGSHDGRAFYAAIFMLTGEKFFGTFGWGNRYLLSELDDRLRGSGTSSVSERSRRSRDVVEAHGGLRNIALDLFATSMATWRDRRRPIPAGLEQNWAYWDDPRRLARRARLFLPRTGEPWVSNAEDALDALALLISRGSERHSLATLVTDAVGRLPIAATPPIISPQRRPAAAILAVSAHLAPRTESDSNAELERFLQRLPGALLDGAVAHGEAILHIDDALEGQAARAQPAHRLIELLTFIQRDQQIEVTHG
jgi:hypothetical protein